MILEEYDTCRKAVINPEDLHQKIEGMPELALCFFPKTIMAQIIETYKPEIITTIKNSTMIFPVYKLKINGVELALSQTPVGAPACVSNLEELISFGIKKILLVGCAGCLDEKLVEYNLIVPTSAIRDEGTSYHYLPVSDEIELDKDFADEVLRALETLGVEAIEGKTWTTDAIFRETKAKVQARKAQGALTVEMECSAVAALCKFRGIKFAQILYGADSLAFEDYEPRTLIVEDVDGHNQIMNVAIDCACLLQK